MKKVAPRITLFVVAIIVSATLFAQEHPKKQSSKELAEKGSKGDVITGKKEQKKGLHAPPVKINKPDSLTLPQKSVKKPVKSSKKL